ncbi:cell wall-active antibiotics response protein LiaF [Halobacillus salinarum]|uniref:Cell wall-active antibiotics response protein LiaF n=1 Tax=Halobacillus salinarum TaxID=2932257 RepID=A0ABY4EST5_9BACI|nr:cell wall-active antibiotics response protein LiaF [Halobacillus salinarum]UOQ45206.1 cell wall-active antibiotics response protein LiaF [Halobacillus salinarum]
MFKHVSTDTINSILIIGVILLVVEVVFFNGGLIFSMLFSGLFIYLGWKKYKKLWGKIFFWIGLLSLVFTILSMIAVRFIIVAIIVLFVRSFYRSKQNPERIEPQIEVDEFDFPTGGKLLFEQKFFGDQSTPNHSYQWRDINIQGGFGDRIIDLSHTVLPEDEAVISIRHLVGNLLIYVPYEVEVSIQHSAVLGRAAVFQYKKTKMFNQTASYLTPDYGVKKPRVKIITSVLSGDIEVKRI